MIDEPTKKEIDKVVTKILKEAGMRKWGHILIRTLTLH
jgi:hypothetical protein